MNEHESRLTKAVADYDRNGSGADLCGQTAEDIRWALVEIHWLRRAMNERQEIENAIPCLDMEGKPFVDRR